MARNCIPPAVLTVTMLFAVQAWAQPGPSVPDASESPAGRLSLNQAINLALDSDPSLAAYDWEIKATDGRIRQSQAWPNPELEFEFEDFGIQRHWVADADVTIAVQQPIPLGKRLHKAAEVVRRGRDDLVARKALTRLDRVAQVTIAHIEALAARERIVVARESIELARLVQESIVARAEAGAIPDADLFRAEAQVLEAGLEVKAATARYRLAIAGLVGLWGGTIGEFTGVSGDLLVVPGTSEELPVSPSPTHLQVMEAAQASGRSRTEFEKSAGVPDLVVGLGYKGLSTFEESALVLSVSVPLPFFDRNLGAVDEARALERKLEFDTISQRTRLSAAARAQRIKMASAGERFQELTRALLPLAMNSHAAVELGFSEGKFTTLDLLESRRRLVELKAAALELALEFNLAKAGLAYLNGSMGDQSRGENHDDQ